MTKFRSPVPAPRQEPKPFVRAHFTGYCSGCGLVRTDKELMCSRCGGKRLTQKAPKPFLPPPDRKAGHSPWSVS